MSAPHPLHSRHVLIVEDDFLVADSLADALRKHGAVVLGPVATVSQALDLIAQAERVDGAVLDIKLLNEWIYPVAEALRARRIPFAFATGYDQAAIDPRFADVPRSEKPVDAAALAGALFR